jgi:hypothetical protein
MLSIPQLLSRAIANAYRYAFDVIGEIFFGNMFGFLEKSEDHGAFIASLDALMPVLCISAIAPWYLRPFVMGSAIVIPAAFRAVKAVDGIRAAAVEAAGKRKKQIADGSVKRNDILQQLFDIVGEKGEKVNFTDKEATLEAWVAMYVFIPHLQLLQLTECPGSPAQILQP